ncbi:MAG: hypothetical protein Q6364_11920 [Candidatus Hermodarchaeota archaeon]|nr:hypothetical protein [Candidatus Hermodarchaeota archaeon]
MKTGKKVAIGIIIIVIISAGIYLGLAFPSAVQSTPVSLTGVLSSTNIPGAINWPNSQMQVIITLTSVTAVWGYEIRDASNTVLNASLSIDTSTTTVTTPWLDITGTYTITIVCALGSLEGTVTVYARGFPFITP